MGAQHTASCGHPSYLSVEPVVPYARLTKVMEVFMKLLNKVKSNTEEQKSKGGSSHLQKTPALVFAVLQVSLCMGSQQLECFDCCLHPVISSRNSIQSLSIPFPLYKCSSEQTEHAASCFHIVSIKRPRSRYV